MPLDPGTRLGSYEIIATLGAGGMGEVYRARETHMLGSPLWAAAFALSALLAPARDLRRRLLSAVAIEAVIGGCALLRFTTSAFRI